jgi:DNA adenine methylase
MDVNGLTGGEYVEPYAGGAGIALNLLSSGHAERVHINDLNPAVFAFWKSVFEEPDELCQLIRDTPVTMTTWHLQKAILADARNASTLQLGFATFFLNRTNRSGILDGGVIGGKEQKGKWKIDVRYHKENLCLKIGTISTFSDRVSLYNLDAELLLKQIGPTLPRRTLIYLDPPYYVKSDRLYQNLYVAADHARIAKAVRKLGKPWVISYDDVQEVRELYVGLRMLSYKLPYSAGKKHMGAEAIFLAPRLNDLTITSPLEVSSYN